METVKIFLSEFWPALIGSLIGVFVVWLVRRYRGCGCLPLLNRNAFRELAGYPEAERKRLLQEASREAFRHWYSFVPIAFVALFFAIGAGVVHTLPKVTTFPASWWIRLPAMASFAVLGALLAAGMTTRYVRPILRACLEKVPHTPQPTGSGSN